LGDVHRALELAVKLAEHNDAALTVIDVVKEPPLFLQGIYPVATWSSVADREDRLRVKTSWIDSDLVRCTTKVVQGRPAVEIIKEVLREGHDLVMKDVQVDGDDDALFFGSVDTRLMRSCPCPVWLVKPRGPAPFGRVLAAVDPQAISPERNRTNATIMELASAVAQTETARLDVVAAWTGPGEAMVSDSVDSAIMRQYLEVTESKSRENLESIIQVSQVPIPADNVHFCHGHPGNVIRDVATKINADLIVMGTLARNGIPGLVMGNTAESVLRTVSSSVLALKPDGFQSPVELN
jgi:nucleotide-binding universal stress UspA family protein